MQIPDAPDRNRLDSFLKECAQLEAAAGISVPLGLLPEQSLYEYIVDEETRTWQVCTTSAYHSSSP